ncbi:TetR/AcrR family transcriptional regulator [Streptosporangium sp. G11]|uniref:TetR/AcrR family transcriptional regulator n=1 Tax=Streptosporangium sp. G11 TaxID=3436926 RepID=UPI003EBE9BEC
MTTTPDSERRTGAETRAEILRVALRLFTEKGFEGTSIRDIADALGTTKSSLYYHFPSKDAIVTSLMEERRHELDGLVDWIAGQPPAPGLLRETALRWIDGTTPERLQAMRLAHANQPLVRRLAAGGQDVRSGFDRVVDLFADDGTTTEDRLLIRMAFDTVSAALLAAQGTDAGPDDVIAAARRATLALTCPGGSGANDPA